MNLVHVRHASCKWTGSIHGCRKWTRSMYGSLGQCCKWTGSMYGCCEWTRSIHSTAVHGPSPFTAAVNGPGRSNCRRRRETESLHNVQALTRQQNQYYITFDHEEGRRRLEYCRLTMPALLRRCRTNCRCCLWTARLFYGSCKRSPGPLIARSIRVVTDP